MLYLYVSNRTIPVVRCAHFTLIVYFYLHLSFTKTEQIVWRVGHYGVGQSSSRTRNAISDGPMLVRFHVFDWFVSKELERDVTTTAMAKAILRLKTLVFISS